MSGFDTDMQTLGAVLSSDVVSIISSQIVTPTAVILRILQLLNYFGARKMSLLSAYFFTDSFVVYMLVFAISEICYWPEKHTHPIYCAQL